MTPGGGSNKVGLSGLRFELSSESYSSESRISRGSDEMIFNFDALTVCRTLLSVRSALIFA